MELEVRHLRALATIADSGSLTRAAKGLGMSQPALTGLLQRIERSVGGRLFFRDGHGCVPTALGAEVLGEARVVLSSMSAISDRVGEWSRRHGTSVLRLGGYCGFLHVEISRWLQTRPWCSGVRLMEDLDERMSIDKVALGAVDLSLVYRAPLAGGAVPEGVRALLIHPAEPVFVAMAHDHPVVRPGAVSLADVAEHPWVDEPPGVTRWSTYLTQACQERGVTLDQAHSTHSVATLLELVHAKLAIGPALATSRDRPGSIAVRALEGTPLWQELWLCYRPDTIVSAHVEEIRARILAAYVGRLGCSAAYDSWWYELGRELLPAG
ncbi:LysR family transcriptional regulator [Actinosynnema sp. NPDC020468]|uniref:LysR family transcriptional regulator n=1 Tax=Actinosynnema sp. NPDC020468 TaxID=3154488 RepID=UPI0033C90231